jgi:serine phosphatase RsbU (regulator of sigma subunit)/anti-sigma regulatory factor (Ser/Thr protein kinase)
MSTRPAFGIRWIVAVVAVVLTAGSVLGVGWVSERASRVALVGEIETRLLLSARTLANASAGPLLGEFPELTLQPIIRTMLAEQPEIVSAVVIDHRGILQGDPDARRLGQPYEAPAGLTPVAGSRPLAPGESLFGNARMLVAEAVIHGPDRRPIGRTRVALERSYLERMLAASRRQQVIVLGVLVLVAVGLAFVSMSRLLRPMGDLRAGLERIGRGDFDTPIRHRSRTELGLLADSINDVAGALRAAQAEMLERERLSHEIELARQIQRSLLPATPLRSPFLEVRGEQRAAAEVGGDSYDILPLPDGRVAVAIADVAGKGLAGCLVMAMLSALLRTLRHTYSSPSELLAALDESLGETLTPGVFVTLFYAVVEPTTGRVTWASAGHNPALVYRRSTGRVERCTSRGIPLGAMRGGLIRSTLQDATLVLEPGDLLVQYTDAFTEAFAPETREPFGLERVVARVGHEGPGGVGAVIRGLQEDVSRWVGGGAPQDDETLLVIGRLAATPQESEPADGQTSASIAWLAEAERNGQRLEIVAELGRLRGEIVGWMRGVYPLHALDREEFELLGSALYEACANIVEHGYGGDATRRFELWWVPPNDDVSRSALETLGAGSFLIRDDGLPYRLETRTRPDFRDQEVWRRGRGLGLEIIHRVMRTVVYEPGTPRGNLTSLRFRSREGTAAQEGRSA